MKRFGLVALLVIASAPLLAPGEEEKGFVSLFNGKDLKGWDGKPGWWRVEDGTITSESTPQKPCLKCNYLIWRGGEPANFELRLEYRIMGGNSGIQFRSKALPDWDTSGYQADLEAGDTWSGALFEHTRGGVALRGQKVVIGPDGKKQVSQFAPSAALQKHIKPNDWNKYRVVARGPEITLFINGVKMSQAIDRHAKLAAARGIIALQMHPGPPMKVQFRNLRLREFPAAGGTAGKSASLSQEQR